MLAGPPIVTSEIQIVDDQGQARLLLSARSGVPVIALSGKDGKKTLEVRLDADGRPAVALTNPDAAGPTAALEIDEKGAHVKFDRPGGASSYVFLNNSGVSGVVLIDAKGVRRLNVILAADGAAEIDRFGSDGRPLP